VYNILLPDSIDEWVDVLLRAKHLAAQLAQGDITMQQFRSDMTYSFSDILKGVLAMTRNQSTEQRSDNVD